MFKIFVLALAALGIAFVSYTQGTKSTPSQNTSTVFTHETPIADIPADTVANAMDEARTINLSGKGLAQTPTYVFENVHVQKLDISNNNLTGSLQGEIRHLQNLTVLDMSHNQFTGVPAEIGQLKNLEILDLSHNHITGLPLELGNLTNLKVLNLKGNQYSEFDLERIKASLPKSTVIEVD